MTARNAPFGATDAAPIRIIGIDPGLRVTGFGLVEQRGRHLRYLGSGVIRTGNGTLGERLLKIHRGIVELVAEYRPTVAVCEIVFVNVNPKSTLLLGQARGAAIAALASRELGVHEYTALQVKQAVVGYGRASKQQVQAMVQRLLDLPGLPSPDAADALACVVCPLHTIALTGALDATGPTTLRDRLAVAAAAQSGVPRAPLSGRVRRGRFIA
jgi:crossover junction endodeoxyribonuclease RuvC